MMECKLVAAGGHLATYEGTTCLRMKIVQKKAELREGDQVQMVV